MLSHLNRLGVALSFRPPLTHLSLQACDGAHSAVRKSLGITMEGDTSDAVWGVMDMYARTPFPDLRKKCVINSSAGSIVIIPREGDSLVRFYIEQPAGTVASTVTLASLQERARLILRPYEVEFVETTWWSAYSIGQRLASRFHDGRHRVFLTGDSCHTHSPKAGQGMNVSLQDGYNIGWKLGSVLSGRARPELLETYVSERSGTAAALINFDRGLTKMFSTKYRKENNISPTHFKEQFVKAGRFTAGQAVCYTDSIIVKGNPSKEAGVMSGRSLDKPGSLVVGTRFPSAQVVRFSDAKAMQLAKAIESDGRWRLVVFGGDILDAVASKKMHQVSRKEAHDGEGFV